MDEGDPGVWKDWDDEYMTGRRAKVSEEGWLVQRGGQGAGGTEEGRGGRGEDAIRRGEGGPLEPGRRWMIWTSEAQSPRARCPGASVSDACPVERLEWQWSAFGLC